MSELCHDGGHDDRRMPGLVMKTTKAETSRMNQLGLPTPLVVEEKRTGGGVSEGLRVLLLGFRAVKNQIRLAPELRGTTKGKPAKVVHCCWVPPAGNSQQPFKVILTKSNPFQCNYCQNVKGMHLIMF